MHRLSLLMAGVVSTLASAQAPPQLLVEATKWKGGSLSVDVSVRAPTSGERVAIGGPAKPWQSAISLKVSNAAGVEQRWPFDSPVSKSSSERLVLSSNIGGGRSYKLTAKQAAKLEAGTYELTATLDLRGAGAGFDGTVATTTTIDLGASPPPKFAPARDVAAVVAALRQKHSTLQRTNGLMSLEAALLDAPELPAGPAVDALVAAHLARMEAHMNAGHGYGSGPDSMAPSKELLFGQKVLITPGRVSAKFKTTFASTGVVFVPAGDLETFWKWIHVEGHKGLHVFAVHARDGVARVATSYVPPGGPPEQRIEISFWQGGEQGWSLVSYEPWPPRARDLHANVHRAGEPPKTPAELTDVERAQWLELRLGLIEISAADFQERNRGGATLERGFGGESIDATYVPLLKARLGVGSEAVRGAVAAELVRLGVELPLQQLVDLLLATTAQTQRSRLLDAITPKLKGGRPATAGELEAILGARLEGNVSGKITADELAVVTNRTSSGGSSTLYRKTSRGWERVSVIQSWVH